jgi:hypothetical protein
MSKVKWHEKIFIYIGTFILFTVIFFKMRKQSNQNKVSSPLVTEIRLFIAEKLLGWAFGIAPKDNAEGDRIKIKIGEYFTSIPMVYFKKSFTEDTPASILADIWDEKYSFFFQRMSSILTEKNHLFNCIADFNKYNNLFPTDVKKLKLNDELKSRIFKEFSFKFITPSSSTTKITKEIYNTYFAKNIVTTTYDNDKNQNVIYEISEKVYEYYELAKNNLVLDNVTYMTYNKIEEIKSEQEDGCFEM